MLRIGDTNLSEDEVHRQEDKEDDAVAYDDSDESVLLRSITTHASANENLADDVFSILRRRTPNAEERQLQSAVAGARGQPMYLCKLMTSGLYSWISYHVLSHSLVAMGLVHEFEEWLHLVESEMAAAEKEQAAVERLQSTGHIDN